MSWIKSRQAKIVEENQKEMNEKFVLLEKGITRVEFDLKKEPETKTVVYSDGKESKKTFYTARIYGTAKWKQLSVSKILDSIILNILADNTIIGDNTYVIEIIKTGEGKTSRYDINDYYYPNFDVDNEAETKQPNTPQ